MLLKNKYVFFFVAQLKSTYYMKMYISADTARNHYKRKKNQFNDFDLIVRNTDTI